MTAGVSADATLIDIQLPNGSARKLVLREHGENLCGHEADLEFSLLDCQRWLGAKVPKPLDFSSNDGTVKRSSGFLRLVQNDFAGLIFEHLGK